MSRSVWAVAGAAAALLAMGAVGALAASPPRAGEVVPRQIPYRGYLDQNGVPVTNTSMPAVFELFTSETNGTAAWTETQTLSVVDGQFTASLGDVAAIPAWLFAQPSLYLQITVDGQLLAGRQRLLTVPYAQYAAGSGFPPGTVLAFAGTQPPPGWLLCDGQPVSRAQYPQLFGIIGVAYGAGDGASTFQLPDLRGRFVRGADSSGNVGVAQDWATALPRAGFTAATVTLSHTHGYYDWYFAETDCDWVPPSGNNTSFGLAGSTDRNNNRCQDYRSSDSSTQRHAHTVTGGDAETRPANVSMNWIIRADP